MVINESLVARTFGTYTLQLFEIDQDSILVPTLDVGLLVFAFLINVSGNRAVGAFSLLMAIAKIPGIATFGIASLWIAGSFTGPSLASDFDASTGGLLAALALTILAYKGFTTITNSGAEIVNPHRNVGRAIIISLSICVVVYMLVTFGVGANFTLSEIVEAKDFALAKAARPVLGNYGLWFTVALAIIATASGLIASVFAVSRMLSMLTDMQLIPHRHFEMTGPLQRHLLVYTVVIAVTLTILFDLSRIAALGAVFFLIMDIGIHWGILRHLHAEIGANALILGVAIAFDLVVLGAFLLIKAQTDAFIIVLALATLAAVFAGEWLFLRSRPQSRSNSAHHH